jgi:DNA repair protein RadC
VHEREEEEEDVALVAPFLRTRSDPRAAAARLLLGIGGMEALARAPPAEIARHLEELPARARRSSAQAIASAIALGRRACIAERREPRRVQAPADVAAWAAPRLATLTHEELWVLALDGRSHLRAARLVTRGGLHGMSAHAADPLRAALRADASAFVLVHNHPSGDPTPSAEDRVFTRAVAKAAVAVGVPLVDHVVIARGGFASIPPPEEDFMGP